MSSNRSPGMLLFLLAIAATPAAAEAQNHATAGGPADRPEASSPTPAPVPPPDRPADRQRLFVFTDIGNEPDDQMSMVRLMLYANEIDIEGLIAGTSVWQRSTTHPETLRAIVRDYGTVRPNLLLHASAWPTAAHLLDLIGVGQGGYGMSAVGPGKSTDGSRALIHAVDRQDDRPLHVALWGGANTLAQALRDVRASRSPAQLATFIAKLRVYAISDQDDAGPWVRSEFPDLSYVVQPSSIDGGDYAGATWTGISGDRYYRNGDGADFETVSNEWLDVNIRAKGPLGRHYLRYAFIMEGDTPSFLNLIANGLESYRSPAWGGWGGRYVYRVPQSSKAPIWTQGGDAFARIDSRDAVQGVDGTIKVSDQATIWRWRQAFQNDFAARMDWTILPFARANHAPVVAIGRDRTRNTIAIEGKVGEPIRIDASASVDPDGQPLHFRWFSYPEAGYSSGVGMADVRLSDQNGSVVTITPTMACRPLWTPLNIPCRGGTAHVILAVSDTARLPLTSYRRIIVHVAPPNAGQ